MSKNTNTDVLYRKALILYVVGMSVLITSWTIYEIIRSIKFNMSMKQTENTNQFHSLGFRRENHILNFDEVRIIGKQLS